jgi:hypothetical protein
VIQKLCVKHLQGSSLFYSFNTSKWFTGEPIYLEISSVLSATTRRYGNIEISSSIEICGAYCSMNQKNATQIPPMETSQFSETERLTNVTIKD